MSIESFSPTPEGPVEVVVRAYRDEPVRLQAISQQGGRIEVAGNSLDYSISYPAAYVFGYDERSYSTLREAYETGDLEGLQKLWVDMISGSCALAT